MKYGQFTMGQVEAIFNMLGGESNVHKLLVGLAEVTVKMVSLITNTFRVLVNYNLSQDEVVEHNGLWSFDRWIVNPKFMSQDKGEVETEIVLFHFRVRVTAESAVRQMKQEGYRPANFWELCALAGAYPDVNKDCKVIALGSVCSMPVPAEGFPIKDTRWVPYIEQAMGAVNVHKLSLRQWSDDWSHVHAFAAVRIK